MTDEWAGDERRQRERDHDLLTRIDENLSGFMKRYQEHEVDHNAKFKDTTARLEKVERYIYLGLGGLIVLEFVLKAMR